MGVEIERKFLVSGSGWRARAAGQRYCQGYLSAPGGATVRVRRTAGHAYLTIKGPADGIARPEFEYEIPVADAEAMFPLCQKPLIEKERFQVHENGITWYVDVFEGANLGLVLAEVELGHADQTLLLPDWVGREVTGDERFRNSRLSFAPVETWSLAKLRAATA